MCSVVVKTFLLFSALYDGNFTTGVNGCKRKENTARMLVLAH